MDIRKLAKTGLTSKTFETLTPDEKREYWQLRREYLQQYYNKLKGDKSTRN